MGAKLRPVPALGELYWSRRKNFEDFEIKMKASSESVAVWLGQVATAPQRPQRLFAAAENSFS